MKNLKLGQIIRIAASVGLAVQLGACAGQPEVSENTIAYSTASPDAETLQQIRAQAKPDPILTAAAMSEADEVVCVREAPTGSLIRVRRCYTRAQLDRQAIRAQKWLGDALSQSGTGTDNDPDDPVSER